mmetsp:Transcript_17822/g.43323  ORF Transcript_17822/g.43323 Transcript_17822/m.43323 type:complete len:181 (-) Transcript_17822:230-772(-)
MDDYYHTTNSFDDGPDHDKIFESFRDDGSSQQPLNHQPSSSSSASSSLSGQSLSSSLSGEMLVLVGVIILVVVILLDATIFGYFIFRRNRREQATTNNKDTPDEEGRDISQLGDPSSSQSTEESSEVVEHGRRERESGRVHEDEYEYERGNEFDEDNYDDDSLSSVSTLKTAMSGLGSIL